MEKPDKTRPFPARAKESGYTVAAGAFLLLALVLALYYIAVPAQVEFHGDCTDTVLWARASAESGRWLSDTFRYACFLPFGGQLLMQLFYGAFGYSITTHILGMWLFTLLFAAAALGLFRAMRWRWAQSLVSAGTLVLLLLASVKSREIFYNHIIYYSLSALFLMAMTALALNAERTKRRGLRALALIASGLLSFMAAANGLSQLALCLVPLMAGLVLSRFLDGRTLRAYFQKGGGLCRDLPLLAVLAAGLVAGFLFRAWLTSGLVAGYETQITGFLGPEGWKRNLSLLPLGWRSLFYFRNFLGLPDGLQKPFEWLCAVVTLGLPLLPLLIYRRLTRPERLVTATHWMLALATVCAWIFTGMGGDGWRLLPLAASALCTDAVALKWLFKKLPRPRIGAAIAAALALLFIGATVLTLPTDRRENAALRRADFLLENGLTKGYATFWYSQAETLLSGGGLDIQPVLLGEDGGFTELTFQSDPAWYPSAAGERIFLLVDTRSELPQLGEALRQDAIETLNFEDVTVLVYDEPFFR